MFWRLFLAYGGLVLCAIGMLGVVIADRVERYELRHIEESLRSKAILVDEAFGEVPPNRVRLLQPRVMALRQEIATRVTLMSADGRVLADSDEDPERIENHANRPEVIQATRDRFGAARRHSSTVGQPMMYVALRTDRPNSPVAYVRVALPLDHVQEQLATLRGIVWGTAGLTAALAMLLAFFLARRMTRPIQELTAGAERIAAGEFGHQVYALGHDEAATLARAFNSMSERLASQFAQLEEDRQKLRAVLSGMVEGVVALDDQQQILFANERAAQFLDFSIESAVGRRFWEVVRQRPLQEIVQSAMAEAGPRRQELTWHGPGMRSLTVHVAQLPGPPGRGAVLVLHDTTELRRLERVRQEFVANVSHELKTPLAVIKAAAETLIDGAVTDPENRGAFLEQIAEQGERLHALILDLLSLARMESETENFEFEPVPVAPAVEACLERHRGRAETKGLQLRITDCGLRIDAEGLSETASARANPQSAIRNPQSSMAVWADEEAVGQILDNLVDNAVKYTPAGGQVTVRWHEDNGEVFLEVEDTGLGIPERDLPRIFERFYRVDKARSRELGGTGLGLSIVKHLAQAMQGSVEARSEVGKGSTFLVRLPRA